MSCAERNDINKLGEEFFKDPYYLSQITDGNGINPLLKTIWTVSHLPLLFLGYTLFIIGVLAAYSNSKIMMYLFRVFDFSFAKTFDNITD